MNRPSLVFFGSSLLSAYWNGAATYYRGIVRALDARGWRVTFYEPDAFERQSHRDIDEPAWARVVVYDPDRPEAIDRALEHARTADVVIKASGVGVCDDLLDAAVAGLAGRGPLAVYWDVDAPATLDASFLPPSISTRSEPEPEAPAAVAEEAPAPAPKKRGRPRKNPLPEASEPVDG